MPKAATTLARNGWVYQIKVTLLDSQPAIWRRLLVPADITLEKLHRVLQVAMGWDDQHLHHFIVGKVFYESPLPFDNGFVDSEAGDAVTARLCDVLPRVKAKMVYEYDFGDSWLHNIEVEKIVEPPVEGQVPSCLAGANACPPEDCGGPPGYMDMLEALRDSNHPEHEAMSEWIGGEFDPAHFDIAVVNRRLKPKGRRATAKA